MTRAKVYPAAVSGAVDQVELSGWKSFAACGLANSTVKVVPPVEALNVVVPMFHWFFVLLVTAARAAVKLTPSSFNTAAMAAVSVKDWVSFLVM